MNRYEYRPEAPFSGRWTLLIVAGVPLSLICGFVAVKLWSAAGSDCEVFGFGSQLATLFLTWPGVSLLMWIAFVSVVSVLRRRPLISVVVGIVLIIGIGAWFVAGTSEMIRSHADDSGEVCPSGTPDWWPQWLPG